MPLRAPERAGDLGDRVGLQLLAHPVRVVQLGEGSRLGGRLPGGMPGVAKRLGHSLHVDVEMGGDAANGPAVTATAGQPFRIGELGDRSLSRCKALGNPGIAQGLPDPAGVDVENGGDPLYRPALLASGGEPGDIGELGHVAIEAGRETGLSQRLTDPSSVDAKGLRDPLGTPPFAAAGGEPVSVFEFGDRSASDHLWNRGLLHRRGTTRPRRRVTIGRSHRQPGMWTRAASVRSDGDGESAYGQQERVARPCRGGRWVRASGGFMLAVRAAPECVELRLCQRAIHRCRSDRSAAGCPTSHRGCAAGQRACARASHSLRGDLRSR